MTEKKWYAVYTKSRCEKKVHAALQERGIDAYLPLVKSIRQWTDRKKEVEIPLINSYLFVQLDPNHYKDILSINGIVSFITFSQKPAVIGNEQMDAFRAFVTNYEKVENCTETFEKGDIVKIARGPMKGYIGEVIEQKGKHKLLFQIAQIGLNLLIEIPKSHIDKV